jgi:FAD synthase
VIELPSRFQLRDRRLGVIVGFNFSFGHQTRPTIKWANNNQQNS